MRHHTVILAGLLGLALAPGHVAAQVSFDPRALSPLQQPPATPQAAPAPATPAPATAQPAGKNTGRATNRTPRERANPARRATPAKPAQAARPTPATAPNDQAPKPTTSKVPSTQTPARPTTSGRPPDSRTVTVPKTPPLPVALPPPPVVVPARPPPPPTPVAVAPDAPGEALPLTSGARITFGPGRSDLNPATDAAIKTLMHAAPASDTTTFTVAAYAQGTPEDPSTARRVSLARALAVRSVLITEGVASVRIYVKALGPPSAAVPQSQDGPPDRVDITVVRGPPPTPAKTP